MLLHPKMSGAWKIEDWNLLLITEISATKIFPGDLPYLCNHINKILSLVPANLFFLSHLQTGFSHIVKVDTIGTFWGFSTAVVFNHRRCVRIKSLPIIGRIAGTGDRKYIDINGDGASNNGRQTYLGNAQPKFTASSAIRSLIKTLIFRFFPASFVIRYLIFSTAIRKRPHDQTFTTLLTGGIIGNPMENSKVVNAPVVQVSDV